jgi:hypothetical protein
MIMFRTRLVQLAAIACVGIFTTACGETTAPELGMEFDTEAALADYEVLDAVLASPAFEGFRALGDRTPFGSGPAAVDLVAGLMAPGRDAGRSFALDLVSRIESAAVTVGPAAAPIISGWTRGATFVYKPDLDAYGLAPGRTGAPETGVRFILYAVDDTGTPIVEQETGYADLIDEGDGSVEDIVLHLIVVDHDVTVLDYRTTLDAGENRGTLTVAGFLQGDDIQLTFDIEAVGTDVDGKKTLDVAFELAVDARDFSIVGSVRGVEEGVEGEGDIEVTVRHGAESMRLEMHGAGGIIEGSVFVNDQLFATVSGPAENPTFLGASGKPLTMGEFLVLRQIIDSAEDVFDFLEDLVDPVDELVILGIIL